MEAEHILEKHINENDLNFIFHEKKDLWQELLNAVNEALGLANSGAKRNIFIPNGRVYAVVAAMNITNF